MKSSSIKDNDTIIALLFRRVGDSLMATPALRAMKEKYPTSHIVAICEPQVTRVFKGLSFIYKVVDVGKSPSSLELMRTIQNETHVAATLDFLSDPRSALACRLSGAPVRIGFAKAVRRFAYTHVVPLQDKSSPMYSAIHKAKLAGALGAPTENLAPEFVLFEDDIARGQQAMSLIAGRGTRTIAMFVSSRRPYKRWPLERFALVAKSVASQGINIAVIGGPGELQDAHELCRLSELPKENAVSFDSIGCMAAFLSSCGLYIGNDGGPKHLAVAVGTPTLTVFQNDPFEYWTPPNDSNHIAIGGVNQIPSAEEVSHVALRMLEGK